MHTTRQSPRRLSYSPSLEPTPRNALEPLVTRPLPWSVHCWASPCLRSQKKLLRRSNHPARRSSCRTRSQRRPKTPPPLHPHHSHQSLLQKSWPPQKICLPKRKCPLPCPPTPRPHVRSRSSLPQQWALHRPPSNPRTKRRRSPLQNQSPPRRLRRLQQRSSQCIHLRPCRLPKRVLPLKLLLS